MQEYVNDRKLKMYNRNLWMKIAMNGERKAIGYGTKEDIDQMMQGMGEIEIAGDKR